MAQLKITSEIAAAFMAARKLNAYSRKQEKKRLFAAIRRAHPALPRNAKIKLFVENSDNPLFCVLRDKRTGQAFNDGQPDAVVDPAQAAADAVAKAKQTLAQAEAEAAKFAPKEQLPEPPAEVFVGLQDEPTTSADTQAPTSDSEAPVASDDELAAAAFAPVKAKKVSKPKAVTAAKVKEVAAKASTSKKAPAAPAVKVAQVKVSAKTAKAPAKTPTKAVKAVAAPAKKTAVKPAAVKSVKAETKATPVKKVATKKVATKKAAAA